VQTARLATVSESGLGSHLRGAYDGFRMSTIWFIQTERCVPRTTIAAGGGGKVFVSFLFDVLYHSLSGPKTKGRGKTEAGVGRLGSTNSPNFSEVVVLRHHGLVLRDHVSLRVPKTSAQNPKQQISHQR
jgi:hypothetical protein